MRALPFHLADVAWLVSLAAFSLLPCGPLAAISLAAAATHAACTPSFGVRYLASYAALPLLAASLIRGSLKWTFAPMGAPWLTLRALCQWSIPVMLAVTLALVLFVCRVGRGVLPALGSHGTLAAAAMFIHLDEEDEQTEALVRVYYPTAFGTRAAGTASGARPPSAASVHSTAPKLPYFLHGRPTAAGFAAFIGVPSYLLSWMTHIESLFYVADGEDTPPVEQVDGADRLPVIVFSHGLGGTPDCYSVIIANFVSAGYVVLAPEHADGSAAFTAFPDGFSLEHHFPTPEEKKSPHKLYRKRHQQLKHRVHDIQSVLNLIERLAKPWTEEQEASLASQPQDVQFLFNLLGGRVDASRVSACGHSFGAASVLATAERDARIACVVALDPWMYPVSPMTLKRGLCRTPVLSICGDGFTKWAPNAAALRFLFQAQERAKHVATPAVRAASEGVPASSTTDLADSCAPAPATEAAVAADTAAGTAPRASGAESALMNKARALASSGARARGSESAAVPSSPAPVSSGEGATITGFNGVLPDGSFAPGMVCAPADATPHPASALLTLVGTEHHNMNDFALILRRPMAMAKMIGKRAHPRRALDLLIDASLQYMGAFGSRAPRANRKSGTVSPASGTAGTAFVARMLQRYGEHEAGGRDGKRSTRPALPHFSDAAWKA